MLHLGCTYFIVRDMERSKGFYSQLLQMQPTTQNNNRWVEFSFEGQCIALYWNGYDEKMIEQEKDLEEHYNKAYIEYNKSKQIRYGNQAILNFWVEDLNAEYIRLQELNIGKLSEIMYVNIVMPYYYFNLEDPDGNVIEITGKYKVQEG